MPDSSPPYEPVEWDETVALTVHVRVRVRSNPDYYEGLLGRTPAHLAEAAVRFGRGNPEQIDGFADFVGDVDIIDVEDY